MAGAGADLPLAACAEDIPGAKLVGAQEGATPVDLLFRPGLLGVEAVLGSARIPHQPPGGILFVGIRAIPVGTLLPRVAG